MKTTFLIRVTSAFSGGLILAILAAGCAERANESLLETGMLQLREGKHESAVNLLEKAIAKNPDNASAYCNLGVAQWELGQNKRAIDNLKRAGVLVPDDAHPHEILGYVYIEERNFKEARRAFEEADKRAPLTPRIITCRALAEYHAGEFRQAVPYLKKALEVDRNYAPALYNLAMLYRGRKETRAEAARYYKDFLQLAARMPEEQILSESIQKRVQVAKEFLGLIQKSADTQKKTLAPAVSAADPPAPADIPARSAPLSLPEPVRDTPPAASVAPASPPPVVAPSPDPSPVAVSPPPAPTPVTTASLIASARRAMEKEAYDEALVHLQQAVDADAKSPDALWELAVLYDKKLQRPDDAARIYRQFKERFPGDSRLAPRVPPPATPVPPVAPVRPKDSRKAMEIWGRGFALHKKGDTVGAITAYREALQYDDGLINAWYNMGLALRDRRELPAARTALTRAVELAPTMPDARYMLALVIHDQKDNPRAIEMLKPVVAANPAHAKSHCLLGIIYREEKNFKMARQHFERYLQLVPPGDPTVRDIKTWLDQAPRT